MLIQTRATEMGRLTRNTMAAAAAISIWATGGMYMTKSPTPKAPAAERRLRCHRLGSSRSVQKTEKLRFSRMLLELGRLRLSHFFTRTLGLVGWRASKREGLRVGFL